MTPYALSLRRTPAILARIVGDVPAERHGKALVEDRSTLVDRVAQRARERRFAAPIAGHDLDRLDQANESPAR